MENNEEKPKKKFPKWAIALIIIGAIVLSLFGCYTKSYNTLVSMDEGVESAWAQVQNQYQRRMDLIPNLVNTVKGYAEHEKDVFTQVADARASAGGVVNITADTLNDPEAFAKYQQVQDNLGASLQRLLMVSENYPTLKADENFLALQDQLEGTENRITTARMDYNNAAKALNTKIRKFPSNIIANISGFEKKTYFQASEGAQTAPTVQF